MSNRYSNEDDIYTINPGVYKETAIYGRSTDAKGHQIGKRINFPPSLIHAVNVLHKQLGYSTSESFIRDATVHRLHFWQQQDGCPPEAEGMIAMIEAQEAFAEYEAAKASIEQMKSSLAIATGNTRQYMVMQLEVFRDTLPERLMSLRDDVDRLVKVYSQP